MPLDKEQVEKLLKEFDVPHAEEWAEEELNDENFAVLAAFRFLRPLQNTLDGYLYNYEEWVKEVIKREYPESEVLRDMVNAGVSSEHIGKFAYWVARQAYVEVLHRLADPAGADFDLPNEGEDLPSWDLKERITYREDGELKKELTNRSVLEMFTLFPYRLPGERNDT